MKIGLVSLRHVPSGTVKDYWSVDAQEILNLSDEYEVVNSPYPLQVKAKAATPVEPKVEAVAKPDELEAEKVSEEPAAKKPGPKPKS